jgi:hypothetical protein
MKVAFKKAYINSVENGVDAARAGHNFRCPMISHLSADPLVNETALILHFENVNLT